MYVAFSYKTFLLQFAIDTIGYEMEMNKNLQRYQSYVKSNRLCVASLDVVLLANGNMLSLVFLN